LIVNHPKLAGHRDGLKAFPAAMHEQPSDFNQLTKQLIKEDLLLQTPFDAMAVVAQVENLSRKNVQCFTTAHALTSERDEVALRLAISAQ
jgi:hypothetical protein